MNKKRKLAALTLITCLLFLFPSLAQENAQTKQFDLENGLKVFLYKRERLPLVNLAFAVNLGSKDETDETNGLVHILEHYILFRGTEIQSGEEITQDIRRHGAYFNAHTGHDLAVFEMSIPSEYADFALKNQKEILFNLKITQEELDDEKQVILEEINQLQDDPVRYASSLVYQNLFQNHPYQRPIYGKKEIIEAATEEQLEKFYRKYFVPSNCALAIVGDFNVEEMEEKIRNTFGDLKSEGFTPMKFEKVPKLEKSIELEREMDVNVAYLVIAMIGPDYNHPDQYAVDILTEIIGRGINPMMLPYLRGRRDLVHRISMNYSTHKYGGAILIYLTLDKKNISFARRVAIDFLKDARSKNYSKKDFLGEAQIFALDYLESARNQIKFQIQKSQEDSLRLARSLARFMLLNDNPERGSFLENIEKVSSSDLRKVAGEYLGTGRYVIVSIYPKKKE
jgi:zinc protease